MAKHFTPFLEHVLEMMSELGPVRARAMFGAWGIFSDDLMFAFVADDTLYFKCDERNRADFEERNLKAFTYESKGKSKSMNYFRAPDEVFDESAAMTQWAEAALDAARRKSSDPK